MSGDATDVQTVERYLNILHSGYKREKKAALEDLKRIVQEAEGNVLVELHSKLQNPLIVCLQDPMEVVREGALLISKNMIEKLEVDKAQLTLLIPALYPRVCREKDHESSEELRLIISEILIVIVDKYGKDVTPYVTEMVDMVCRLLKDASPDIKTTTSRLVVKLVTSIPYDTFAFTKKLFPPLVGNVTHQRWKVRVSSVEAIEWLMLKGDNKCVADVTPALNKKMMDSMYQVRLALVRLAGHWLVKLPDRYSFFAHLIPMVLSGLADDNQDVVSEAAKLWEEAGYNYLKENEKEYKDKINYESDTLEHYPPGIKRPTLGCRILIEREASKFLLALVHELTDWVEMVRIKASMLLTQVTLHFEQSITMSIRKIISQICKAAKDRETPLVVTNVKQAAEYMGYFIPADVYCKLIVEYMREAHEGELLVVAAMVRGSQRSGLVDNLDKISTLMENVTFKGREQLALLDLIFSVMRVCQSDSFIIGNQIWAALISVAGLAEADVIRSQALNLLDEFAALGGGNKKEVFGKHCLHLLKKLPNTVWTVHCQEQFLLLAIVNFSGEIVEDNIQDIIKTLQSALNPDNDPEVLLKTMMSINDLLSKPEITLPSDEALATFVKVMLSELLPPHLKWVAGRSAEAIRTIACTCLYMCLCKASKLNNNLHINDTPTPKLQHEAKSETCEINELASPGINLTHPLELEGEKPLTIDFSTSPKIIYGLGGYVDPLLPLIMSLTEDPAPKTRLLALNCTQLFAINPIPHQPQHFSKIISQVLKRLDDADKDVRAKAVQVIKIFYDEHVRLSPKEYVNSSLVDFVYSTLLIHLDDRNPSIKHLVLECLETMSVINPSSLRAKVLPNNFRDKEVCEKLISFLEEKIKGVSLE